MKSVEPKTLKGFRDFLPKEARKRQYVVETLKGVFESFGFEPLETPVLEYEEILAGKYGDEGDKLMYRFEDNGKRRVAMRYDQTVPLARVVVQYQNELSFPFKRYQIQPVWRAENTQKGRFREFLQCDIDTVGTDTVLADAEIIAVIAKAFTTLGFSDVRILLNDRIVFDELFEKGAIAKTHLPAVIRSIDKLTKIGREGVVNELKTIGLTEENAIYVLQTLEKGDLPPRLSEVMNAAEMLGVPPNMMQFTPTLARGLDYYTSTIIEIEIGGYEVGSVGGGGRYDNLVGMFSNRPFPAVGFAFGFDRMLEAMDQLDLFPVSTEQAKAKVLVTVFSELYLPQSVAILTKLQHLSIPSQLYLSTNTSMEKQLKYANALNIPFVTIVGPDEAAKNVVTVKNLLTREQKNVSLETLPNEITA